MLNAMELALIKKLGGGGGSSGGGSGADLLNADGIIKQEVLPNGYPYAVEAVLLPETTVEISPDMGVGMLPDIVNAAIGNTYTVIWNGKEYECVCAGVPMDGGMIVSAVGDIGVMNGEEGTGEPFVIMFLTAEQAAMMGAGIAVSPLDGSTSVTLSVLGESVTKMDSKFLPSNDIVVAFDGSWNANEFIGASANYTAKEIYNAITRGISVKATLAKEKSGAQFNIILNSASYFYSDGGAVITFAGFETDDNSGLFVHTITYNDATGIDHKFFTIATT